MSDLTERYTQYWSEGIPGYGDTTESLVAISIPNERRIVLSDGRILRCNEPANEVRLSDGGQVAWQGQQSGYLYSGESLYVEPASGRTRIQVFQTSFLWVGETLTYFDTSADGRAQYETTGGGWRAVVDGQIEFVRDTNIPTPDGPTLFEFTRFAGFSIGQGPHDGDGICVQFADEAFLRQVVPGDWRFCKFRLRGDALFLLGVSNPLHQTTAWMIPVAQLRACPRLVTMPTFTFDHPVLIAPFKDPNQVSGAPARIDDGSLGRYTELPDPTPIIAANPSRRVLVAHDAGTRWTPPSTLRPWDIPLIEFYLETTDAGNGSMPIWEYAAARWYGNLMGLLAAWPGDVGVIPMFYLQQKPDATDPRGWSELWTVEQALGGLTHLSPLVNLSPRVKIIAPFAYDRANGITAHPELQRAFAALLAAGSSRVLLATVEAPPPPPSKPPAPPPVPLPVESDDMPLMDNDQYEKAIVIAGDVAFKHLSAARVKGATQDLCRQKAREATDRFKNAAEADKRNPTIQELADNALLQLAKEVPDFAILDAYTAECLTLDREFKTQEGLRRG